MSSSTAPAGNRAPACGVPVAPARLVVVDLARALAILMMLQGHTLHAVLSNDMLTGVWFRVWLFMRGQTSCLFFLLSGFAFTLATFRHWTEHLRSWTAIARRLRRFGFFLLLGYALHSPGKLADLYWLNEEGWRSLLAVDVLQCLAVILIVLQVLVLLVRTPGRHALAAGAGCAAIVGLTPVIWRANETGSLPIGAAAFLSPATGSLFPLFPWGAYVLFGAVLGHLYRRHGPVRIVMFANRVLLPGGGAMIALAVVGTWLPLEPFGQTDFWSTSPNHFLLRAGIVLLILGLLAHVSGRGGEPGFIVRVLARESLMIYAVHLCLVYGSPWNVGLYQLVGPTLPVVPALGCVLALWVVTALLACGWHWCKHSRPRAAPWVRVGIAGLLFGRLL
ncbi:MAG: acyltransferase family protein [Acidobacteriota bacterium]